MGDAGAAHPADGGEVGELAPEPVAFRGVLADQKRSVALRDARGDQPVGRQMRVRSGEAETGQPVIGDDPGADDAPVGDCMRGVGNRPALDGNVQNEGLDGSDLQSDRPPIPLPELPPCERRPKGLMVQPIGFTDRLQSCQVSTARYLRSLVGVLSEANEQAPEAAGQASRTERRAPPPASRARAALSANRRTDQRPHRRRAVSGRHAPARRARSRRPAGSKPDIGAGGSDCARGRRQGLDSGWPRRADSAGDAAHGPCRRQR